jgi:hypothetical protein
MSISPLIFYHPRLSPKYGLVQKVAGIIVQKSSTLWCLMPLFTIVLYYYVELEGLRLWCLMPLFTTVLYYYVELEGLGLWCLMPLFTTVLSLNTITLNLQVLHNSTTL